MYRPQVVETIRRKKSRGLGVFQYAETVEDSVWDNAERRLVIRVRGFETSPWSGPLTTIQDKISRLAKQLPKKSAVVSQATYPTLPLSRDENLRRYTVVDRDEVEHSRPAPCVAFIPLIVNGCSVSPYLALKFCLPKISTSNQNLRKISSCLTQFLVNRRQSFIHLQMMWINFYLC